MLNIKSHPITRNLFSLVTGQTISLLLNFISITLIARYLGVTDFGLFSYTVALVSIIAKLIDFGLVTVTFRESSKEKENYNFLNTAITLRIVLFVIVIVFFNGIAWLFKFSNLEILLSNILLLNVILSSKFQNFRELLDIPFKITLTSHYSMIALLLDNFLLLVLIFIIIQLKLGIIFVVLVYVISNLPGFLYLIYSLYKRHEYRFRFTLHRTTWLIKESLPLFVYVLLAVLIQQVDILLLKNLDSEFSAGIYSAAMRLTLPLMIIPSAIVSTIFSTLVKNVGLDENRNKLINRFIFKTLFLISFGFTVLIGFKSTDIVTLVFGPDYLKSALALILLLFTQIFLFSNYFTINLLTIYNKQRKTMTYAVIVLLINFILNIVFIPLYSFNGAGIAKLVAVAVGTFTLLIITRDDRINPGILNMRFFAWIVILFTAIMLVSSFSLFIYIILSIMLLILITLLLKYFSNEEILMILKLINKEKWGKKILKL